MAKSKKKDTKSKQIPHTVLCPLCREGGLKYHFADVHYWVCEVCPFIGFEFYEKKDIINLSKAIK